MGGNSLLNVQLREVNSKQAFISKIAAFSKTLDAGSWIVEGNWDHTLWGGALTNKEWIDTETQDNPVALYRMDGHIVFTNSKALELAGIDKNTPEVANGTILRNSEGNPTGFLKSNAMNLLLDKIPPMTANQKEKAIVAANNYFLAQVITSVHDVESLGTLATALDLLQQNKLKLRIYSAKILNRWQEVATSEFKNSKWIKTGIVKGFVNGSLGSHTAALKHPIVTNPAITDSTSTVQIKSMN
jgi:predicted amidohydrolase YtcJ